MTSVWRALSRVSFIALLLAGQTAVLMKFTTPDARLSGPEETLPNSYDPRRRVPRSVSLSPSLRDARPRYIQSKTHTVLGPGAPLCSAAQTVRPSVHGGGPR